MLCSCGEGNKKIETGYLDIDLNEYIKLPENYLDFSYEKPQVEITDEMVDNNIALLVKETDSEVLNNEGEIKSGDKIEITYEAKDEEGNLIYSNTNGYKVTIDEDYMTEDLNDALKGHKVGDTVEIAYTISEDFSVEESLQGQKVTYYINIIAKYDVNTSEFNDEWVKQNSDCETMDEYRESVKSEMYDTYYENALDDIFTEYWDDLMDKTEVLKDFPEDLMMDEIKYFQGYVYNYGYSGPGEDMQSLSMEYANEAVKMKMLLYKIASDNDLIPTEKEFKAYCRDEIATKNYNEETFENTFGFTPYEYGIKYGWIEDFLNDKVQKLIMKTDD